jgi:hypothetical protein
MGRILGILPQFLLYEEFYNSSFSGIDVETDLDVWIDQVCLDR